MSVARGKEAYFMRLLNFLEELGTDGSQIIYTENHKNNS